MALPDFNRTGPGTVAGNYMRQFWQCVGRSADLPAGRAKPIRVMSEEFTLYRGASGKAYVVAYRCAHRGTQLSVGWVEGEEIRCLYHGWKYDAAGNCTEQPAEPAHTKERIRIAAYPTGEHLGLIFAYFGEGAPPPFPHIPAFRNDGLIITWVEEWPSNAFQCFENDFDEYHVSWTHKTGGIHSDYEWDKTVWEETDYGMVKRGRKTDGSPVQSQFILPMTMRNVVPSPNKMFSEGASAYRDSYLIHVPIDDETHYFYGTQEVRVYGAERETYLARYQRYLEDTAKFPPCIEISRRIMAGKAYLTDYLDHPWFALIEDQCAQGGQGAMADRSAEHLGKTDVPMLLLRRVFARELQALAEGRPLKRWGPLTEFPIYPIPGAEKKTKALTA